MEQFKMPDMDDGFDESFEGKKKPFILIDFNKPETDQVVFVGEAASEEEAISMVRQEKDIVIDYDKHPEIQIAFQDDDPLEEAA